MIGYAGLMTALGRRDDAATLFGLGLRHGPRAGHDVRRLVDAELAPFFDPAVDDPRALASHPLVMSTPLEDLPAVVATIVGE